MRLSVRLRAALSGDDGSATLVSAWVVAVVLALAAGTLLVVRAEVAAHRARSGADLAALAGAHALRAGLDGCGEVRRIARANAAEVTSCRVDDRDVVVAVAVDVDLGVFGVRPAAAVARAGPG